MLKRQKDLLTQFLASKKLRAMFLDQIFRKMNKKNKWRLQYIIFSKETDRIKKQVHLETFSDVVILLQGPIPDDVDQLLHTIRTYLDLYLNLEIVISTWSDKNLHNFLSVVSNLPEKYKESIHILGSDKPEYPGIANINLQIYSTRRGLDHIANMNKKYVLKSRTDQELLNCNAISILRYEWKKFNTKIYEKEKIVIASRNTFLFRPYSYSDMLQFGTIKTLSEFWDVPLDQRKQEGALGAVKTPMEWSKQNLAEVYLVRHYLKKNDFNPHFNFLSHLEALSKYFIVVDSETLGFYWSKYSYNVGPWKQLGFPYPTYEISAYDWENISVIREQAEHLQIYCSMEWK